jgi:hypothetical protein
MNTPLTKHDWVETEGPDGSVTFYNLKSGGC